MGEKTSMHGRNWTFHLLDSVAGTSRFSILQQEHALSFRQIIALWKSTADFRQAYLNCLSLCPYAAYFWEHKPVSLSNLDQAYEMVLVETGAFAGLRPNATAFKEHFEDKQPVAVFPNLSGDATLLAPAPLVAVDAYTHLAAFVRDAPAEQQHCLLETLARTLANRIGENPLWVSTSGLGVSWLHIRLDRTPKYYSYAPYKKPS